MFDHLDDRDGFRPSSTMLTTAVRDGRRRRRRARLAQAGTASVATLALGAGVAVTSFNRKLDSVERVQVAALADDPPAAGEPYTILLVGLDQAQPAFVSVPMGPNGEQREMPSTRRSDTIALVRLLPAEQRYTVMQLPRDLLVDIPGHGEGRINSALLIGGPNLLVETIELNLGLTVDRYAELDFEGARAIGDAIGGLSFHFQHPTRDRLTGFHIEDPGCHRLDGQALLAFVRSRHLETQVVPGRWELDEGYDLSRMVRQGQVAMSALEAFSHLDATDPAEAARFVDAVVDNVALDATFDRGDMLQLFRDVAGSEGVEAPLRYEERTMENGAAVLAAVRDRYFDESMHLFLHGELPADRPPVDPRGQFPPDGPQPWPQRIMGC